MSDAETNTKVSAVVLAGSGGHDRLAVAAGVAAKALLPLAGKPMGAWVLDALTATPAVADRIYVGPSSVALEPLVDVVVPAGKRLVDSLALGLGAALGRAPERPVLVLTADIPWLTAGAVERFLAGAAGADLAYPILTEAVARAAFPEQERTYARLREGRFTGGNLMLFTPRVVPAVLALADRAYRARKNPLALSALVGTDTLVGLVFGRASVAALERRVSAIIGARARAVVSPDACLGADIDRPEHLRAPLPLALERS